MIKRIVLLRQGNPFSFKTLIHYCHIVLLQEDETEENVLTDEEYLMRDVKKLMDYGI